MKKCLHFLTLTASGTTAAFVGLIAFGLISLPVFLSSSVAWLILLAVNAYSPRERASWLPRLAKPRVALPKAARRAVLPYAA